ncbi:MAG TPA: hypothetical protein VJ302_19585 [Blastocatellia bacterium]|nr:hypothetical protein [Blastocatellia bacterium]
MQPRPIRSRLFLPVIRLGLVSDDWKWVAVTAFVGFFGPYIFWKLISPVNWLRVPIFLWIGVLSSAGSYGFFFWIRIGKRPRWFQHTLTALVEASKRRRALPADTIHRPYWLKDHNGSDST